MIRPWYRSRLFWLGVPGFVFLVWAWIEFVQDLVEISWTTNRGRISIGSSNGEFFSTTTWPAWEEWSNGLSAERVRNHWEGEGEAWTLRPFGREWTEGKFNRLKYQTADFWVAGWFACLLYLIAWIGASIWWQRRKSRRDSSQ